MTTARAYRCRVRKVGVVRRLSALIVACLLALPLVPAAAQPAPDDGPWSDARSTSLDRDAGHRDAGHRAIGPGGQGAARPDVIPPSLRDAEGPVEVVAELTRQPLAATRARGGQGTTQTQQRARIASQQDGVVSRAQARDASSRELARVQLALNAVVLEVPAAQLGALAADPDVERVTPVPDLELDLAEAVPHMGGGDAHDAGATGEGIRIAVIDTGVDYTHLALGGSDATLHVDSRYTVDYLEAYGKRFDDDLGEWVPDPSSPDNREPDPSQFPNHKVVDGYDFVGEFWDGTEDSPPLDPNPDPIDFNGHGTHVAHIAAGSGLGQPDGMAPDAEIVAIKVCSSVTSRCSGAAMLQAIDFALSPSGDPDMSDRVDVINMSLGTIYGQATQDPVSTAVENATAVGVLTVASAGNAADNPYITGTPAAAPSALSVAAASHPTDQIDVMQIVEEPGTVVEEFPAVHQTWSAELTEVIGAAVVHDTTSDATVLGCFEAGTPEEHDSPWGPGTFDGEIVLVDRGACHFSVKVANVARAGGSVAVIAQDTDDPPFGGALGDCPDGACEEIPAFMVFLSDGDEIKARLAVGPVEARFDPDEGLATGGAMAGFSSRGPSMDGNLIKPEITGVGIVNAARVGTGDGQVQLGGTSMSSPAVAGAAAAVLDGTRDGGGLRGPHEIKSVLMNTADRGAELTLLEESLPGEPGGFAPLTRAGTGNVDAGLANASPAAMWDAGDPTRGAALSFGFVDASASEVTLTRGIAVRNYSAGDITYDVSSELRYPGQPAAAALAVDHPATVLVPAGSTATFDVTLTIDSAGLERWRPDSGFEGANGALFSAYELDGFIVLTEQGGDSELTAAFHVLPRQSGETSADTDTLRFVGLDPAGVTLSNAGVGPSFVDTYDLLGASDEQEPAAPGAGAPVVDLRAAGIFQADIGGDCGVYVELAVSTWHRTTHANQPASFEFWLDVNGDSEPDLVIFNLGGEAVGLLANNLTWAYDVAAEEAVALTFVEHPTNSANTVMWLCSDWVGMDADVGDEISVDVLAADVAFTGRYTDIIAGATITLGVNAFEAAGDFDIAGGDDGALTFRQTPGHAAEGAMLVLTALRDTGAGWSYSGAPEGAEVILLGTEVDSDVERLWGDDRFETAVAISQDLYPDDGASAVVLARGDLFADALAGAPFAVAADAPLLLTPTASLHSVTRDEIQRVVPEGGTVHVLGGPMAISGDVVTELEGLGYTVERIAGDDRIETAIEVARELGDPDTLLITTGANFPDALAAGAAAVEVGGAVLLTTPEEPAPTLDAYLDEHEDPTLYAIGGPAARAYPDATPVFGDTRLETAVDVAEEFFSDPVAVGVSRDDTFPDALGGSAHIGRFGGPLLLTNTTTLSGVTGDYLCDTHSSILQAFVYGGELAVSGSTFDAIGQRVRGDGC